MTQPNILYIHSHDTGRYIQPYGHAIPTPNLQALAEEGVLFRQAFSGAPTCSPSRACLLTGQCAHSSGMIGLAHRGFSLSDYGQHLVHTLRKAGYTSALAGVQHVAHDPTVIGYDRILETHGGHVATVAPAAVDYINNAPPQPFFLAVGFSETHREYIEPSPIEDDRYCLPPHPLPDTPETRHDMACYKATARVLDQGVGAVLDALEANGLTENTLVISTTDHGIAFPGMKCNLTNHGIGVMLIMRGPNGFSGGQVCDALVSQIDIYPTICELLGIEPPDWLQGASLMPLIRGEAQAVNEAVYADVTYHAAYEPMRSVRTSRYNYVRRFQPRHTPVFPNCDDSLSKNVWLRAGWAERTPADEQLYDLTFDPIEVNNVAADPRMSDVLGDMRQRLADWMTRTDDPLLQGQVPAPSGARVNDPDGLSPREPAPMVD